MSGTSGPAPSLKAARAWVVEHPGCDEEGLRAAFGLDKRTAGRWWSACEREGLVREAPPDVPPPPARGVVPAAELPPDIRADARAAYIAAYRLVRLSLERMLRNIETDPGAVPAAALRSLQQVAVSLVKSHPGLLAADSDGENSGGRTPEEDHIVVVRAVLAWKAERERAALGQDTIH